MLYVIIMGGSDARHFDIFLHSAKECSKYLQNNKLECRRVDIYGIHLCPNIINYIDLY